MNCGAVGGSVGAGEEGGDGGRCVTVASLPREAGLRLGGEQFLGRPVLSTPLRQASVLLTALCERTVTQQGRRICLGCSLCPRRQGNSF